MNELKEQNFGCVEFNRTEAWRPGFKRPKLDLLEMFLDKTKSYC